MYNSAGKFSTNVETIFSGHVSNFPSNRRLRLLFNGVGGLRPREEGAFSSPGRACQRCNIRLLSSLNFVNPAIIQNTEL